MKPITRFLSTASSLVIGTLIYSRFLSSAHEFDWTRAVFVGVVSGLIAVVLPGKKPG